MKVRFFVIICKISAFASLHCFLALFHKLKIFVSRLLHLMLDHGNFHGEEEKGNMSG